MRDKASHNVEFRSVDRERIVKGRMSSISLVYFHDIAALYVASVRGETDMIRVEWSGVD